MQEQLWWALLGNLLGWASTAAGAALVYPLEALNVSDETMQVILDGSLGASVGVMLAASFFSLLAPAIEEAELLWPENPHANWMVAASGFLGGGLLMILADQYLPEDLVESFAPGSDAADTTATTITKAKNTSTTKKSSSSNTRSRSRARKRTTATTKSSVTKQKARSSKDKKSWRRIVLLVIAISLHNAPEGGAVGVAFGGLASSDDLARDGSPQSDDCATHGCAPRKSTGMTFATAKSVAIGIGLQNFPEGLAVSLPLRREGCTLSTAFMWGQMSGLVEVFSGFLGAYLVQWARFCLPVALSCAAGAMIYVCCGELLAEAHMHGNSKFVNAGVMIGFTVMMILDVALG
jgi:zinc transporter 11